MFSTGARYARPDRSQDSMAIPFHRAPRIAAGSGSTTANKLRTRLRVGLHALQKEYTDQTPPMGPGNAIPKKSVPGKWHPQYEIVLDALIVDPYANQRELSERLALSKAWLCQIINSDMFKERLRERRAEINSAVANGIAGKIVYAADLALDRTIDRLENNKASEAFEGSTRDSMLSRLGYIPNPGPKGGDGEQVNPAQKAWLAHKAALTTAEEVLEGDFKELPAPAPASD